MRVLLFQAVRELLFNVVKHAGVDHATVLLGEEGGELVVRVADGGRGFDPAELGANAQDDEAFGLYSVRERLGFFGGRMEIDAAPGEGARVTLRMPSGPSA